MRARWYELCSIAAVLSSIVVAVLYPSTTYQASLSPDLHDLRVPLRIGIVLLGIGAASMIELVARRGAPGILYAMAVLAATVGAFIPLWLLSWDAACPVRFEAVFESDLRCRSTLGSAAPITGIALAIAFYLLGRYFDRRGSKPLVPIAA